MRVSKSIIRLILQTGLHFGFSSVDYWIMWFTSNWEKNTVLTSHKMATILTQNDNKENSCHFVNLLSLKLQSFFWARNESRDPTVNWRISEQMYHPKNHMYVKKSYDQIRFCKELPNKILMYFLKWLKMDWGQCM